MADYKIPKRTCVRCGNYWDGWGGVCNQCRTIETLEKQVRATNAPKTIVGNTYDRPTPKFKCQADRAAYEILGRRPPHYNPFTYDPKNDVSEPMEYTPIPRSGKPLPEPSIWQSVIDYFVGLAAVTFLVSVAYIIIKVVFF